MVCIGPKLKAVGNCPSGPTNSHPVLSKSVQYFRILNMRLGEQRTG